MPSSKRTQDDSELSDQTKTMMSLQLTPKWPRADTEVAEGCHKPPCPWPPVTQAHTAGPALTNGVKQLRDVNWQKTYLPKRGELSSVCLGLCNCQRLDWEHWDLLCPDVSADTLSPYSKAIQASRMWLQSKLLLSPLSPYPSQLLIPVSSSEVPLMPTQLHHDSSKTNPEIKSVIISQLVQFPSTVGPQQPSLTTAQEAAELHL